MLEGRMTIIVDVQKTARSKGLRSGYALQKAAQLSPSVANRMWKGGLTRIDLSVLTKVCETLGVEPQELIRVVYE